MSQPLDDRPKRQYEGLSPSSLALYQSCQRKYYHKKIAKTPIDSDASEDTEAFSVGKAFHKILEDRRHSLSGLSVGEIRLVVAQYGLEDSLHSPLLYAMLRRYKEMHEKSGLKVVACEIPVETPTFFGIVDVVLKDAQGHYWLGDMKTAASVSALLSPTLYRHQQLNLYAAHWKVLAEQLELPLDKLKGCRYRLTTKSKLIRKKTEDFSAYAERIYGAIKSLDFILPLDKMDPEAALAYQTFVDGVVKAYRDEAAYCQNFSSCTLYWKPCEFWSRCHGATQTELQQVDVVSSD